MLGRLVGFCVSEDSSFGNAKGQESCSYFGRRVGGGGGLEAEGAINVSL